MNALALITAIATTITALGAVAALSYYRKQALAASKDHLNNVHQMVFERLDKPEIRAARHYVYAMDTAYDSCSSEQTMVDHGLQREWRLISGFVRPRRSG
jgi:hypothetical protein